MSGIFILISNYHFFVTPRRGKNYRFVSVPFISCCLSSFTDGTWFSFYFKHLIKLKKEQIDRIKVGRVLMEIAVVYIFYVVTARIVKVVLLVSAKICFYVISSVGTLLVLFFRLLLTATIITIITFTTVIRYQHTSIKRKEKKYEKKKEIWNSIAPYNTCMYVSNLRIVIIILYFSRIVLPNRPSSRETTSPS